MPVYKNDHESETQWTQKWLEPHRNSKSQLCLKNPLTAPTLSSNILWYVSSQMNQITASTKNPHIRPVLQGLELWIFSIYVYTNSVLAFFPP